MQYTCTYMPGKSSLVRNFLSQQGLGDEGSYVELDPDSLRFYSKEYRCCLSGAHAAKLPSVRQQYGDRLMSFPWHAPIGGFSEDGIAVAGETGEPEFCLALATAATRSTPIVHVTEDHSTLDTHHSPLTTHHSSLTAHHAPLTMHL